MTPWEAFQQATLLFIIEGALSVESVFVLSCMCWSSPARFDSIAALAPLAEWFRSAAEGDASGVRGAVARAFELVKNDIPGVLKELGVNPNWRGSAIPPGFVIPHSCKNATMVGEFARRGRVDYAPEAPAVPFCIGCTKAAIEAGEAFFEVFQPICAGDELLENPGASRGLGPWQTLPVNWRNGRESKTALALFKAASDRAISAFKALGSNGVFDNADDAYRVEALQ